MPDFTTITSRATSDPKTIVLPEGEDPRVIAAASQAFLDHTAQPILLGDPSRIRAVAKQHEVNIEDLQLIDPATSDLRQSLQQQLFEKREHKGMTFEKAATSLNDPLTFACMMVSSDHAAGCVAGAVYPTADVVRSSLQLVGKHPDYSFVSSFFMMLMNQPFHPVPGIMVFADCALVIEPNEEELADIAVVTGESTKRLLGLEPEIALLSFSTNGSANHQRVSLVREATKLAQTKRPDWRIIGDVQLDAAVVPAILAAKAPEMASEKPVNILVFPNLDAGNIGYKMCERFGGAQAIGPILQGLQSPVNDLSRGCKTADIVNIIAVTSVQAQT